MNRAPSYMPYHPRWLRQPVSTYWWLHKRSYFWFILREASSIFVAWFVIFLLLLVRAVGQGASGYQEFLTWSSRWPVVLMNVVSLAFIVFHMITFFVAAPQALVLHLGRKRVPGVIVAGAHYAAMLAASIVIAWLLLRSS